MAENALIPQELPALAPLAASHEADQVEAELKALAMRLFDLYIRSAERAVNTVGVPHLGPFSQVEMATKADGLALKRAGAEQALRYLYKAWRARNPKRGFHMTRIYLQLLWPNAFELEQLWCPADGDYPADCVPFAELPEGVPAFRTSRVYLSISAGASDGSDVLAVAPALRSVLPARILLEVNLMAQTSAGLGVAAAMTAFTAQSFTGTMTVPDQELGAAAALYRGAAVQSFTGAFV